MMGGHQLCRSTVEMFGKGISQMHVKSKEPTHLYRVIVNPSIPSQMPISMTTACPPHLENLCCQGELVVGWEAAYTLV